MNQVKVSNAVLQRLPQYLAYLKALPQDRQYTSATIIAKALNMGDVLVRKDLASICDKGRPKIGYEVVDLLEALESYLGYKDTTNAVLVGTGKLGRALLDYTGFKEYGINVIAGFDNNYSMEGSTEKGKQIYHTSKLKHICEKYSVNIGIITVPAQFAQEVCDLLIDSGVKVIWNFAPIHIKVSQGIMVKNENLAASLALLVKQKSAEDNI